MPRFLGLVVTMLVATLPLGVVTDEALANHVQCGDVITQDTRSTRT